MINLTQFKITNISSSVVNIPSLDNFSLAIGATGVDLFDASNGNFGLADIENNAEIEALLQNDAITAVDQDGGVFETVVPLYGSMYTIISDTPSVVTTHNYNPTGWYNAKIIQVGGTQNRFITGFVKTYDGDHKIVRNSSNNTLSYLSNNSNSAAGNRLLGIERTTNNTKKWSAVVIYYDGTLGFWKMIDAEKP